MSDQKTIVSTTQNEEDFLKTIEDIFGVALTGMQEVKILAALQIYKDASQK